MPRGYGPMFGPMHGRRGFGWGWWGLGIFGFLLLFAKLAFLLLPLLVIGLILYALLRR